MIDKYIKESDRFHKLTMILNKHWLWNGSKTKITRHGIVMVGGRKGRKLLLHRYMFCLFHKLDYDDDSFTVNHICNVPNCWSLLCLYKGTQKDNVLDSVRAGTHHMSRRTHCTKGHLLVRTRISSRDGVTRRCLECK